MIRYKHFYLCTIATIIAVETVTLAIIVLLEVAQQRYNDYFYCICCCSYKNGDYDSINGSSSVNNRNTADDIGTSDVAII